MAVLNLGTVVAISEESSGVIGSGKTGSWTQADVVGVNADSSFSPETQTIERQILNGSYYSCANITGTEQTSSSITSEIAVQPVTGTESGKLKAHVLWKSALGVYIENGASLAVAQKISEIADPVATPGTYDLYRASRPNEPRTTLCAREYLGGTNLVMEHIGMVVENTTITLTSGELGNVNFSMRGIGFSTPTGQTPLESAGCEALAPFVVKNAIVKVDGLTVPMQDITLTLGSTLSETKTVTSTGIGDLTVTAKTCSLSYTVDLIDLSAYTKLKNNTVAEVYIELVNGNDKMAIYLPKTTYSSVSKNDNGGIITLGIEAMCSTDAEDNAIYIATKKG